MFAGLVGLDHGSCALLLRGECSERKGSGRASGPVGSTGRKRLLHRQPGLARAENQRDEDEEEEGRGGASRSARSGRHVMTRFSQHMDTSGPTTGALATIQDSQLCKHEVWTATESFSCETPFNSSFSFIQESLNCSRGSDSPENLTHSSSRLTALYTDESDSDLQGSGREARAGREVRAGKEMRAEREERAGREEKELRAEREERTERTESWSSRLGAGVGSGEDLPSVDAGSVDTELTSSLSMDSDSASSVTSGYESAAPAAPPAVEQVERAWEGLVKKYDAELQEYLQKHRTQTKVESLMLKLRWLKLRAVEEEDFDAESFGRQLEELCQEQGALRTGNPSQQPPVAHFLQRLRAVVNSSLQRTDSAAQAPQLRESVASGGADLSALCEAPLQQRERLVHEKRLLELEMLELEQKRRSLEQRRRSLEQQIQLQEQWAELEDLEASVLQTCSASQIQDLQQKPHLMGAPPPEELRLQEQMLSVSIREATEKVMTTQRLGRSLRKKVSEKEAQVVALHEAKQAAISGGDFSAAKALRAELEAESVQRRHLEALILKLQTLSSNSRHELRTLKESRQMLRQQLELRLAQHESRQKDNATNNMKKLEDRLHNGSCPGQDGTSEADLEACLGGLQLRATSVIGSDAALISDEDEQDSAMLTALGGRWCPEADLQNSQFTKKLEEFLFCLEDNPADGGGEAGATDLTEQCDVISERLMGLEEELQRALHCQDHALTQSVEREVQTVKATLQSMLARLQDHGDEDDLTGRGRSDEEDQRDLEDQEDEYFTDDWDI